MLNYQPLDQFEIIFLGYFKGLPINNSIMYMIFMYLALRILFGLTFYELKVIPNNWQRLFESLYLFVFNLIKQQVGIKGYPYFPLKLTLFLFILIGNLFGMTLYSFTITSHLIVTFALALMTFIGINLICVREHGINMLSLFLPPGSSMVLAFLLVPIEIVSYIFRPISLSVRLFANMMAGHTLLKVIAGFAWTMMLAGGGLFVAHVIPLAILVVLMLLELGVAAIQAYVFTILTCIYLNDAIHLH